MSGERQGKAAYHQKESEGVAEDCGAGAVLNGFFDLKAAGCKNDAECDPETAVRGERSGTEGVSDGHFPADRMGLSHVQFLQNVFQTPPNSGDQNVPHARKQLHQPSVPKSQSHHNVRHRNTARPHINQPKHESRQSETAQAQWRRIGDLAVLDLLVGTGLELTTEGGQTVVLGVDMGERTISEASGSSGGLVLFVSHLAMHAGAFFVGEVCICFDGHFSSYLVS